MKNKTAIIAICKGEDLYIEEWLTHHLGLGFDNIIIGLNDDEFKPPVEKAGVIYEDYSGVSPVQTKAYTELYEKYQKDYDWLMFIDCDEFVMFDEHYVSIADFLKDFDCDVIRLNEKHFSDGDMLDADGDYRVVERFTEPYYSNLDSFAKSIINTRVELNGRMVYGHGIYDKTLDARNAYGDPCECYNQHTSRIIYDRAWINHYPTKTIGEFLRYKAFKGGPNGNPGRYSNWEKYFFRTNRRTDDKIDYAMTLINELKEE